MNKKQLDELQYIENHFQQYECPVCNHKVGASHRYTPICTNGHKGLQMIPVKNTTK